MDALYDGRKYRFVEIVRQEKKMSFVARAIVYVCLEDVFAARIQSNAENFIVF